MANILLPSTGKSGIKRKSKNGPALVNGTKGKKKLKREPRGVVYIGSIPHGFYEDEMRSYFRQFGAVTRVRVARSQKTGNSKGYGWVEFKDCEVAKIAADTMNNYLMFDKLLKARYVPPEEQHAGLFVSKITKDDYPLKWKCEERIKNHNITLDEKMQLLRLRKIREKIQEFKNFLEERGIEFNFKVNDPYTCVYDSTSDSQDSFTNDKLPLLIKSEQTVNNYIENDPYAVLEIDESDDDIQIKVPSNIKCIIKPSSTPIKNKNLKKNVTKVSKFPKIQGKMDMMNGAKKTKGVISKMKKKDTEKKKKLLTKTFKKKSEKNVNIDKLKKKVKLTLNNNDVDLKQKKKKMTKVVTKKIGVKTNVLKNKTKLLKSKIKNGKEKK